MSETVGAVPGLLIDAAILMLFSSTMRFKRPAGVGGWIVELVVVLGGSVFGRGRTSLVG